MKTLIVFATLLMVPIVMKFQQQVVIQDAAQLHPARVTEVLARFGVVKPTVSVEYLDVTIGGYVRTAEDAEAIGREITALRGLRLVANDLQTQGWFQFGREQDGAIWVKGEVAPRWSVDLLKGQQEADSHLLVENESVVMAGPHPVAWGVFWDELISGSGVRSLRFEDTEVTLSGEATPELGRELELKARELADGLVVKNEFSLYPSFFHYPSRTIQSSLSGEALRSLSRSLADITLAFRPESSELLPEDSELISELAGLLSVDQEGNSFVIGAYPDWAGEGLAEERAIAIKEQLVQAGVSPEVLVTEAFEMTEDRGEYAGKIELLVR